MLSEKMKEGLIQDLGALGGLPLYILAIITSFFVSLNLFYIYVESLILAYIITFGIRLLWHRERPKKRKHKNALQKLDAASFPSLHAMRAMIQATALSFYFSIFPLIPILFIFAAGTAYTRIDLKEHHAEDSLAGMLIGILIVYLLKVAL